MMKYFKTVTLFAICIFFTGLYEGGNFSLKLFNPATATPPASLTSSDEVIQSLFELESMENKFIPVCFRDSFAIHRPQTNKKVWKHNGVILAEETFNQFCESRRYENVIPSYAIPQLIHLIWLGSSPPLKVRSAIKSWVKHHPGYTIKLWQDEDIENFQWSCLKSEKFFQEAQNWAEKSDILRFEILYQFGGIYSDTDVVCLKSLENLLACGLTFFAGFENNSIPKLGFNALLIGSAVIGAMKNSPIMKRSIDYSQTKEEAPPEIPQYLRSGPGPLSMASYESLENGEKDILILPVSYFYPLPWEQRNNSPQEIIESITSESMTLHLWEGSWLKADK